ncbi:hypothetical protein AAFG07_00660 [Bradyrhizobium sp. B097]|uniref:hypothetical protein n=1 Tax=Bradyrhizobium sp. B097 TaxID=3140244 RepID=UPI003183BC5C
MLQRAAEGSAWDVRALPPAVAVSASPVQPRAAPAVQVLAMVPASRQAARAAQARLPAEAEPGARRAVRVVRERPAEQDVPGRPRAAEAERGAQARLPAELVASDVAERRQGAEVAERGARALRPAAEPDAARLREAALADAARLPEVALADAVRRRAVQLRAVPDAQVRPVLAVASAFRQVRALPLAAPVRRPAAKFVRATLRWRIASPSAQSWQAARDEALS